jgi:Tetratricopeptide repeat
VWATVLYNGTWYAMESGQYGVAEKMARTSLEAREEIFNLNDAATFESMSILALVLRDQGYEQAEEMGRRALAGQGKVLEVDHPDALTSVYCLAHLLDAKQDLHEALDLYQCTSSVMTKLSAPTIPLLWLITDSRRSLLEKMGNLSRAPILLSESSSMQQSRNNCLIPLRRALRDARMPSTLSS